MNHLKYTGTAEAINSGSNFITNMKSGEFDFVADEPFVLGGEHSGPTPGDYLCMALASCKAMTMRMYARRKQWQVDTIIVKVNHLKGNQLPSGINTFYSEISVTGNLDEEQEKRLVQIGNACPISRLLQKKNEVVTILRKDDTGIL